MMGRHRPEEEHENHERWLVSYADFITLLFAFFVVMYAISSVNEGKYRVLSDALVSAFRTAPSSDKLIQIGEPNKGLAHPSARLPGAAMPVVRPAAAAEETDRMKKLARQFLDVLQPMVRDGNVRVTQTKRGIAVEINASLLFEPADANLHPASMSALKALALRLSEVDNLVQVEGYTDDRPIRTPQYPSNWELSAARAGSVVRLFAANGVATHRLVAVGYGENRPIAANDTAESRARNRRVNIQVLADSKEEVAVLE
jgi:chemotaxis protein MotB